MPKRLTLESFIKKANLIHNLKYDYSQVEYKNSSTKVKILCPIHGLFEQVANCHLQGQGCKKCGDIQKGLTYSKAPKGESIADKFPELCKDWSRKNEFGPDHYRYGSKKKVWWNCHKCNHEWQQVPVNRTIGKTGCPACRFSSKIVTDKNRLSIQFPKVAEEWDYKKNYPLTQDDVSFGISKKVWWICPYCQYSYYSSVSNRTQDRNCPKCRWSKGERFIALYLDNNSIPYQPQYRISECRNLQPLPFDFAIWINDKLGLIEYNGIQHYKSDSRRFSPEKVEKIQFKDNIKKTYCNLNQIPLLIIPYSESDIEKRLYEFIEKI